MSWKTFLWSAAFVSIAIPLMQMRPAAPEPSVILAFSPEPIVVGYDCPKNSIELPAEVLVKLSNSRRRTQLTTWDVSELPDTLRRDVDIVGAVEDGGGTSVRTLRMKTITSLVIISHSI